MAVLMRVADVGDEARARFHTEQLGELFDQPAGDQRAAAAVAYIGLLAEWTEDAMAVRDVEVWRLRSKGWGPTQLAEALGVHRTRGDQLLRRADEHHGLAQRVVTRLQRRVTAARRNADPGAMDQED